MDGRMECVRVVPRNGCFWNSPCKDILKRAMEDGKVGMADEASAVMAGSSFLFACRTVCFCRSRFGRASKTMVSISLNALMRAWFAPALFNLSPAHRRLTCVFDWFIEDGLIGRDEIVALLQTCKVLARECSSIRRERRSPLTPHAPPLCSLPLVLMFHRPSTWFSPGLSAPLFTP